MKKYIYCLLISFLLVLTIQAAHRNQGQMNLEANTITSTTKAIDIDNLNKSLHAPSAASYQWFKDGELLLGETDKSISVISGGNYKVEMLDGNGNVSETKVTIAITAAGKIIRIYLIGDSTMATFAPSAYPLSGWGAVFQDFFSTSTIEIINKGVPSMSTKTFYTNYWAPVKAAIATGDYVFIQFGHNDLHYNIGVDAYKQYLTMYVNEIRAKGAIPIFVTSMIKNVWTNGTVSTTSISPYPENMRSMATSLKVPLIDLNKKSADLIQSVGKDYATWCIYNYLPADGTYVNYPSGNSDATHFQESGAIEMARLVIQGITESSDANLKVLVPSLKPVYEVAVSAYPKGSARVVTRTQSFPAGITVTLRTVPNANTTFINWNNAANKSISSKQITWFTMGAAKTSYSALYKGYVITGLEEESMNTDKILFPNPFQQSFQVNVKGKFDYSLVDMHGTEVSKGTAENELKIGEHLSPGIYFLKIQNSEGTKLIKVIKD